MDMPSSAIASNYWGLQDSRISRRPCVDWQNIYRIPARTQTRDDLRSFLVVVAEVEVRLGMAPRELQWRNQSVSVNYEILYGVQSMYVGVCIFCLFFC